MSTSNQHLLRDPERMIEFEIVRATENAALNAIPWLGRGEKEKADAAACDAIYGVFDLVDICGEVVIGEGIKDKAPGIFLGEHLGTWNPGTPKFDIALDPIDGTTNIAKGLPNSIAVIAAAQVPPGQQSVMKNITSFYCQKLSYGPRTVADINRLGINTLSLDTPIDETLQIIARARRKRVSDVVVCVLDRPRNQPYVDDVRAAGASLRMVSDGDIAAAIAPALPDTGIDLYIGIGGTPEGILTAAALKCLGGNIQMRIWYKDEAERQEILETMSPDDLRRTFHVDDLIMGDSAIFSVTGISESPLVPGVKLIGQSAVTSTLLMRARSKTVRRIEARHNLDHKTIRLRSIKKEHHL